MEKKLHPPPTITTKNVGERENPAIRKKKKTKCWVKPKMNVKRSEKIRKRRAQTVDVDFHPS